ncbi:MAG: UDP-phosphate glycosyltransferase [Pseudonocardiales bacterium]|nr:UDP-phosphate glycosyltransferase [Pseudonocardiales bacterium]
MGLGLLVGTSVVNHLTWLPLIIAMIFFFVIGLVEDLHGIPILARLVLQLGVSALVSALLVLSGPQPLLAPLLVVIISTVWITGFANAFNFMDGINGISGAHAVLGGLAFVVIGKLSRDPSLLVVAAIVVAAGLAFLPWNAVNAKVFLGDVGSYTLGAVLAVLVVYSVLRGVPVEAALAPLSLYLADTGWTLGRRILRKTTWLQPHREHAYQRLCDAGWAHHQVTALTFGVGVVVSLLGAVSLGGDLYLRVAADGLAIAILVCYLAAPRLLAGRPAPVVPIQELGEIDDCSRS